MLKSTELRVGNKFKSIFGNVETVLSIMDNTDKGKIKVCEDCPDNTPHFKSEKHREMYSHLILCWENGNQYKPCEISGEPLTKEWLLKFGFKKVDEGPYFEDWKFNYFKIRFKNQSQRFLVGTWGESDEDCQIIWLEFVHQLQNLYYMIKSKELTAINTEQATEAKPLL